MQLQVPTVDGSEILRSPVEVGSDYPIILKGFSTIPGGFIHPIKSAQLRFSSSQVFHTPRKTSISPGNQWLVQMYFPIEIIPF